jgi:hypothetical protein
MIIYLYTQHHSARTLKGSTHYPHPTPQCPGGTYLGGICSGLHWCSGLEFGIGELREVGHHTELVHVGIDHILRTQQLHTDTGERIISPCWASGMAPPIVAKCKEQHWSLWLTAGNDTEACTNCKDDTGASWITPIVVLTAGNDTGACTYCG